MPASPAAGTKSRYNSTSIVKRTVASAAYGVLAMLAAPLSAQAVPNLQDQALSRAAANPYHLAHFINLNSRFDWAVIWKALGCEPIFMRPCGNSNGSECSTELIAVLDPDQVILLIHAGSSPSDVYLRYSKTTHGNWHFEGAREATIHNHPRRHEVERIDGQTYLRISVQGVSGSDIDSETEEWFDLTRPGFEPVFSFDAEGHQQRLGLGIGRRLFAIMTGGKDEIDVLLEIHFLAVDHVLGILEWTAVYKRSGRAKTFTLENVYDSSNRRSKISNAEFTALTDLNAGPSNEDLLRYVMPALREIASGPDSSEKRWLKLVLSNCSNTPEVRELAGLLR